MFVEKDELLVEDFPVEHRCDTSNVLVFTRGIKSFDGDDKVEIVLTSRVMRSGPSLHLRLALPRSTAAHRAAPPPPPASAPLGYRDVPGGDTVLHLAVRLRLPSLDSSARSISPPGLRSGVGRRAPALSGALPRVGHAPRCPFAGGGSSGCYHSPSATSKRATGDGTTEESGTAAAYSTTDVEGRTAPIELTASASMPSITGGGRGGLFSVHRGALWWLRRCHSPLFSSLAGGGGRGDAPHLPVLIVGAGPVGLVLSFLLTKFGIKCAVIEKNVEFTRHPRAHFINNRTMEIFRKLDGLAGDIERSQPPVDLWRKFVYCTSLSGSILGSVDHMKQEDFDKVISPVSVAHFSQYKLVDLLLKKLEGIGFRTCFPGEIGNSTQDLVLESKILMGHECTSLQQTDEGILVGASVNNGGRIMERKLHCGLLLGTDGARSTVRELAGISMKGERDLQKLVSVHFLSRDLGRYLSSQRPGMLFFVFNPGAIGVLVAHDLENGEFVLQVPFYPPQQMFEDFSAKVCEQIIVKLVGWEPADVHVLDIKPWAMHAEVAEKYICCNNRVILSGDAAHRFPPAGGFGMNTGVQDVHNLAWKLGLLLNGVASPSILQTYESERRPVAIFNTKLSVENFKAAMSIPATLGLDPTIANSVHQVINRSLGSIIPRNVQKAVLEGLFSLGRAQVSDYILNEKNPLGSLRLSRLRSILDEGKSLQLQFPAEDLGFYYEEGALVPEASCEKTQEGEKLQHSKRASREYIPSAKVGSRLPHMLVRGLPASSEGMFSTLDLVSRDKLEFVLIIAPVKESYEIARATLKIADELKLSAKVCVMWPRGSTDAEVEESRSELVPWTNYIDVEEVPRVSGSSWWETCRISRKNALLVRPDEHIAWRTESDRVRDAESEIRRVFSHVLCLNSHRV